MKSMEVKKGDLFICQDRDMFLEARGLGSCLAICVHDPVTLTSALGVAVLPADPESMHDKEGYSFIEPISGLAGLFRQLQGMGCKSKDLKISLVGAGRYMSCPPELDTGAHLYKIVRKVLAKNKVKVHGESVGGPLNRSVEMRSATGEVKVMVSGGEEVLL